MFQSLHSCAAFGVRQAMIKDETGTQRLIGYVLDVGQPDKCARCHLTLNDDHLNRFGALHGGIAATLLDNALGATASLTVDPSGRAPFATITMNTSFIATCTKGSQLTATGKAVGGGRSLVFVEGDLTDATGRLIAKANAVFKRVPQDKLS